MQTVKLDEIYRSMQGYRNLPVFTQHPEALAWYDSLENFININWRAKQRREEQLSQAIEEAIADRANEQEKAHILGRPLKDEALKANTIHIHELIRRQREQNYDDIQTELKFVRAAHEYVKQSIDLNELLKLWPS